MLTLFNVVIVELLLLSLVLSFKIRDEERMREYNSGSSGATYFAASRIDGKHKRSSSFAVVE